MRCVDAAASGGAIAPIRVALIAGAYQDPEDFLREGFADAVRKRGLRVDLQFIAPDLEHLQDRTILEALDREIVAPARASGCRFLWIGGISLGCYIALAHAARRRSNADGLYLIAPYLGNRIVIDEIERAGGLRDWRPGPIAEDDEERRIWRFLQTLPEGAATVRLGIGRQDRFGRGQRLLAGMLPADSIDTIEGGHEWPVWRRLWEKFLDRLSDD